MQRLPFHYSTSHQVTHIDRLNGEGNQNLSDNRPTYQRPIRSLDVPFVRSVRALYVATVMVLVSQSALNAALPVFLLGRTLFVSAFSRL